MLNRKMLPISAILFIVAFATTFVIGNIFINLTKHQNQLLHLQTATEANADQNDSAQNFQGKLSDVTTSEKIENQNFNWIDELGNRLIVEDATGIVIVAKEGTYPSSIFPLNKKLEFIEQSTNILLSEGYTLDKRNSSEIMKHDQPFIQGFQNELEKCLIEVFPIENNSNKDLKLAQILCSKN